MCFVLFPVSRTLLPTTKTHYQNEISLAMMLRCSFLVFALAGVVAQEYQDQPPRLRQLKAKTHKASKVVRVLISAVLQIDATYN